MTNTRNTNDRPARRIVAALALAAAAAAAALPAACNTTEGVGKDLESAGKGIKDTARDAKD